MKRLLMILLLLTSIGWGKEPPFSRGVNLTGWFQTSSAQQIHFTKFTKQDFQNIQSLGCDVIRLPINLHFMTNGAPNYELDPLFLYFLDQVVDWAEALEMHLLLDNHTFSPSENTAENVGDILVPVWTQMAEHFKNRSTFLYYEVLNEPHGINDAKWNEIQQRVIEAIRKIDSKHTIIIGPAGWNSYNNLKYMPVYSDDNLIYTFHFYDPFVFTHQGASWTNPSLVPLAGVPFPYDAARMPACPPELKGTWIEGNLNHSYKTDGTEKKVKELIDIAVKFKNERNVPLFCGEFGVYIPNCAPEDRVAWYRIVPAYLQENGIAWTMWDYTGGFGLFEANSSEMFEYDLNIPLVEALGLNPPPQKEFVLKPDSTEFDIYTDYFAERLVGSSWAGDGLINYYSQDSPVKGNFCIMMTEVGQYNHVGFDFKPIKDLSKLVEKGFALDFWVRSDHPTTQIDVRFIDTKTDDPEDHPWRMRITVDKNNCNWEQGWNHLQIPLSDFTEHGSWDNGWFNPRGDFDWTQVAQLQFVAEHHDFKGIKLWLDNIRVVDPEISQVDKIQSPVTKFALYQNFPNPFNPQTAIQYRLSQTSEVKVSIFNATGQRIRTLIHTSQPAGNHTVIWYGKNDMGNPVSSGVYFYTLETHDIIMTRKMILMR